MCSTPKPKRKIKATMTSNSVGILATMSNEKRRSFAKCANQASKRRIEMQTRKVTKQKSLNSNSLKPSQTKKAITLLPWLSQLLMTRISELIHKLAS